MSGSTSIGRFHKPPFDARHQQTSQDCKPPRVKTFVGAPKSEPRTTPRLRGAPHFPKYTTTKMAWLGPIIATLERSIRTRKYQRILKEEKELKSNPFIDDEAEDEEKLVKSAKDQPEQTRKSTRTKKHSKAKRIPKKHSRPAKTDRKTQT